MNQQQSNPQNPMAILPEGVQAIMGDGADNNGQPITPEQIKQNRTALMREQQEQSNQPFDPDLGIPMDTPNAAPQNPFETVQQPAPQPQPAPVQQQQVQPQPQQPQPQVQVQQPAQPQLHPFQPQPQPQPNEQQQQPLPAQPADPNVVQQTDPALAGLTPEEVQTVQSLRTLMAEEVEPTQPQGSMTQEQVQTMLLTLANNQQQMFNVMQQPGFVPNGQQPALTQPTTQYVAPQVAAIPDPADPLAGLAPATPAQDPFSWNAQPPQPTAGIDPATQLLMGSIQQLNAQVANLNNGFQQSQAALKRESDISSLMSENGINREYAERAQSYFDKGEFQKGSQVLMLASAPVIARMQASTEREVRRDAAGQPLTPAQQGGVFTVPDQTQAVNAEWQQLQLQPNSETKRLALIEFLKRNPSFGAAMYGQEQQTLPAPLTA